MRWRKLGRCDLPMSLPSWLHSHAAVPFAEPIDDRYLRVWFSGRDQAGRSHTAWTLLDLRHPNRTLEVSPEPVLAPGDLGGFDDSGAMLSWMVAREADRYLYYIGWNLGVTVPFRNAVGLAVSRAGGPFRRYLPGPILDRTATEPHFVASCCVLRDGDAWRLWYVACEGWELIDGKPRHRYLIRHADSTDGVQWTRNGNTAIGFASPSEYAISRPSVLRDGSVWRMWYSHRGSSYRIGYAESSDGSNWQRLDHLAGIDVGPDEWDAEMIEYPHVFDVAGQRYMLYNGNGYGRTGFGLAILEKE